jgi:hypothetical protein
LAAKEAGGETFNKITGTMPAGQKAEIYKAWDIMRTVQ